MSKTQRWDWAIGLNLETLGDEHLQAAYKLNWDNLCKFDSCRKNCKKILCLACFDRSWIDSDKALSNNYDNYDTTNAEQPRKDTKSFVGLKNLGATCYVNCLLQLWFHNPALRKAIYEWEREASLEALSSGTTPNGSDQKMIKDCDSTGQEQQHRQSPMQQKSPSKRPRDQDSMQSSPVKKSFRASADIGNEQSNKKVTRYRELEANISLKPPTRDTVNQNSTTTTTTTPTTTSTAIVPYTVNIEQAKSVSRYKDDIQMNPIEQLQLIFARMQFTNKKSIDPFCFIESLALNAAEQQDAQEFGNLFMEFLEKSFANQGNSFVSKIIKNQFCGRYSYATICDHCKHSSLSDSKFYELDLSIQNMETVHDCLNEFFRPVPLDGKYNCSHCQKAQSAHRKIILKSLPPTLNLQLLRFVYDVQRNVRQKLNSHIIFPEILDMGMYLNDDIKNNNSTDITNNISTNGKDDRSSIYVLSAVLIHRGSSPHSGHYIAHIKDRATKDWYKFNDDTVEKIGPQLQVSADGESIAIVEEKTTVIKTVEPNTQKVTRLTSKSLKSKTAYMLVYQAQDNETLFYPSDHSEDWHLPDHLQTAVLEENSRSEEMFKSLQIAKEVDQQIMEVRRCQIKSLYEKLVCRNQNEPFEFIDKSWLQLWLTDSSSSAKFKPINNSHLLCIHNKLDFRKIDQVKCVRSEGVDELYKEFGGGPRLKDSMCRECVELEVKLIQLKDRMKEDQKHITSQAKFKLDAFYDFADAYLVGKNSYRDWQSLVMIQFKKSYPELLSRKRDRVNNHSSSDDDDLKNENVTNHKKENSAAQKKAEDDSGSESDDEAIEKFVFNSDILCEHNQLVHDTSAWRIVPKEVWAIFVHYFGNDPERPLIERNANTIMCPDCKMQEAEHQEIVDIQRQKATELKSKLLDLFHNRKRASWCSIMPFDVYYALDREFLIRWQKFIRNPCNQEEPERVCNQNKLICEHGKLLYDVSNSNPILPECPFVLINEEELKNLKSYYAVDHEIMFSIDPVLAKEKLQTHITKQKAHAVASKKINLSPDMAITSGDINSAQMINQTFGIDSVLQSNNDTSKINPINLNDSPLAQSQQTSLSSGSDGGLSRQYEEDYDLTDLDWSDCVVSEPNFCSNCHEMLKQDELKKLLNYESATIYITKVESQSSSVYGPHNNPASQTNGGTNSSTYTVGNDNCDTEAASGQNLAANKQSEVHFQDTGSSAGSNNNNCDDTTGAVDEQYQFRRRKKVYIEDEANDFVPPGTGKQISMPASPTASSTLRRTTRRNRNREQAYTIKPSQTLLQLKKEIFNRCQVLPMDQRLFLNDVLLDDNSKTMSELRIVPNCSLKLEVDKPMGGTIDLIEDESASRKSCAQPETGFKGSLLLSNSHL